MIYVLLELELEVIPIDDEMIKFWQYFCVPCRIHEIVEFLYLFGMSSSSSARFASWCSMECLE